MIRAALLLASAGLLAACEDEFDCSTGGCDGGTSVTDASVPGQTRPQVPVLLEERLVSGGFARVRLELLAPEHADAPAEILGGPWLPEPEADVRVELQVQSTTALLGGRHQGDFVPYLRVDLSITNKDTSQVLETTLVPAVSIARGLAYARNLALLETLGTAQGGYSVAVTIRRPAFAGEAEANAFSPGLVVDEDLVGSVAGTLLGERPTQLNALVTLRDLGAP